MKQGNLTQELETEGMQNKTDPSTTLKYCNQEFISKETMISYKKDQPKKEGEITSEPYRWTTIF